MANRHKKLKKEKLRAFPQKSGRQHSVTHTPLEYEQKENFDQDRADDHNARQQVDTY